MDSAAKKMEITRRTRRHKGIKLRHAGQGSFALDFTPNVVQSA
jgi:hypothetical protein